MMNRALTSLAALAAFSGAAFAGDVTVVLTGTVLTNSYSSGLFAGAQANDTAVLSFNVTTPGVDVVSGQLTNYAIDLSTFDLDINGSTGAALGGATNLQIQNDFPMADGFRINQTQLATGEFFESGFGAGGSFFSSTDIEQLFGTYDVMSNLTSFGYVIQGGGGFMEIFPEELEVGGDAGVAFCFGDGSGTACPCGNPGAADSGCANSTGSGAILTATGTNSILANDLVLSGSQLPAGTPGLYFSGTAQENGGMGIVFGDGLRCASANIVRMEVVNADGSGNSSSSVSISSAVGATSGSTNTFQLWYRDPSGPCSGQFNTTNGYEVTWSN